MTRRRLLMAGALAIVVVPNGYQGTQAGWEAAASVHTVLRDGKLGEPRDRVSGAFRLIYLAVRAESEVTAALRLDSKTKLIGKVGRPGEVSAMPVLLWGYGEWTIELRHGERVISATSFEYYHESAEDFMLRAGREERMEYAINSVCADSLEDMAKARESGHKYTDFYYFVYNRFNVLCK